jgi:hypothetical protein
MDDKDFRKHLAALVHGHHHPEEHDWSGEDTGRKSQKPSGTAKRAKPAARKTKRRAK